MPPALDAGLDDVRGELVCLRPEPTHLLGGRHAPTVRRQPRPEHVRDELEIALLTDRAASLGLRSDVLRGADQLGVRVADLIARDSPDTDLVDEHLAREPVVDDAAPLWTPSQRADRETHAARVATRDQPLDRIGV